MVRLWSAAVATASLFVGGPSVSNLHMTRSPSAQMSWSDPDWQWGSATGEAHRQAQRLREELASPAERTRFLTGLGMMDADDFRDSKVVLALTCQRAAKRCFAAQYGLDEEEQQSWRSLMDDLAACRFEGNRGDLLLADAIMERVGLIEGKKLANL